MSLIFSLQRIYAFVKSKIKVQFSITLLFVDWYVYQTFLRHPIAIDDVTLILGASQIHNKLVYSQFYLDDDTT